MIVSYRETTAGKWWAHNNSDELGIVVHVFGSWRASQGLLQAMKVQLKRHLLTKSIQELSNFVDKCNANVPTWKCFAFLIDRSNPVDFNKPMYKTCHQVLVKYSNTTNLYSHLKKKHPELYDDVKPSEPGEWDMRNDFLPTWSISSSIHYCIIWEGYNTEHQASWVRSTKV